MKKILTLLILSLLVGSAFATDWVKYGTYENSKAGIYDVFFDYDATEPFDLEKESVKYILFLQKKYKKIEVYLYNMTEDMWCAKGVEHNCYATLEVYEDYIMEDHVNNDGTVTEYVYYFE